MEAKCEIRESSKWPLERVLFAMAGTVSLAGGVMALVVSPWFALLPVLAGVNQWLFVLFGACPASIILSRFTRLEPAGGSAR